LTASEKIIWVKNGNELIAKKIEAGLSDGINLQVLSGLNKNDEVVVGIADGPSASSGNSQPSGQESPFMPKPPEVKRNKECKKMNTNEIIK
jgi:HlyD family secretion protein